MGSWMPSRASSDSATSSGLRIGDTIKGRAPKRPSVSIQKGSRRQMRGSLMTNIRLSPNWFSRTVCALSWNWSTRGEEYQPGSKVRHSSARHSSSFVPAETRISRLTATISGDSQNPRSLEGCGAIRFFGRSQPRMPKIRAMADVPLRCIPATTTAILAAGADPPVSSVTRSARRRAPRPPVGRGLAGGACVACSRSSESSAVLFISGGGPGATSKGAARMSRMWRRHRRERDATLND